MFETLSQRLNEGSEVAAYSWKGLKDLKPKSVELPVISCWLKPEVYYDYVRGNDSGVFNLPPVPEEAFIGARGHDRGLEREFLETVRKKYGDVIMVGDFKGDEIEDTGYDLVLGNFGVIEEHGHHLPLDSDNIRIYGLIGEFLGKYAVRESLMCHQAPSLSYGVADPYWMDFPGTINTGDSHILFLTAHNIDLHRKTIERVVGKFKGYSIKFAFDFGLLDPKGFEIGGHASRNETSVIMYYRPGMVDMSKAVEGKVDRGYFNERGYVEGAESVGSGVDGYDDNSPRLSTPGFGEKYVDAMVKGIEGMYQEMSSRDGG
jgi:creatinine amidohydrolase/Fe(II)-dependent formamide hydrolase-like protein